MPGTARPMLERLEERLTPSTLPDGLSESLVANNLHEPTAMEFAPDGRLFVAEEGGNLRVIKDGTLLETPFLSLSVDSSGERGLLGIAFDPDFTANQYVYVYYTAPGSPAHNRVSRFTAAGDVADPVSEVVLLNLDDLGAAPSHNGGAIHFGLDGKLYIGVGENTDAVNSQTLTNLLGKVLRINADGSIPPDNPFVSDPNARREIWAYGFRNPYTFAVQPGTGRIFVNDVGSVPPSAREEVNDLMPGGNYGWPIHEGYTDDPAFISPLYAYPSGQGDATCAIVGGTFYNPDTGQFPSDYAGSYFFADWCAGWIRRIDAPYDPTTVSDFATNTPTTVVDLKVDSAGSLYYLTQSAGGAVYRIDYAGTGAPAPSRVHQGFENPFALARQHLEASTPMGLAAIVPPGPGMLPLGTSEALCLAAVRRTARDVTPARFYEPPLNAEMPLFDNSLNGPDSN